MSHLLYSSNEMYSSTDLIRKSKIIFNKIINEEIDKAIILRDGKPSFMLLDFDKYERIMTEYDKLKAKELENNFEETKITSIDKEISKEVFNELTEKNVPEIKHNKKKINPALVVPPPPKLEEDKNIEEEKIVSIEQTAESEVKEGLEVLDNLDFDDEFKKEVERKVRARKEQEIAIKKAKQEIKSPKKINKTTDLKEFWA